MGEWVGAVNTNDAAPRVVVIAGVNGAGKTTVAHELLVNVLGIQLFTNADAIARGLNSLNPESESLRAGRILLDWLKDLASARREFGFETTLASRTYAPWLRSLKNAGYRLVVFYFWLASPDVAVARVAQRVRSGGHAIPEADIRRRYTRSVRNFLELYRPLADQWEVYDNTNGQRQLIAAGRFTEQLVATDQVWDSFVRSQTSGDVD